MDINRFKSKNLFWDVNVESLDTSKDKNFIISRILELGDIPDTKELFKIYTKDEIVDTITVTKLISAKTANFFKKILNISDPILCLSPSFRKTHNELWKK